MNVNEQYDKMIKAADELAKEGKLQGEVKKEDAGLDLTDDQIGQLNDIIEDRAKDFPSTKMMEEAKKLAAEDHKGQEAIASVIIDPVTGRPVMAEEYEQDEDELQSFEEMLADESIEVDDIDIEKVEIKDETIKDITNAMFSNTTLSIKDFEMIRAAVERFKKGEKFSYYTAMPEIIKTQINSSIGAEMSSKMGNFVKEGRNYMASTLLQEIVSSEVMNVATYDYQKNIRKAMDKGVKEMKEDKYWSDIKSYFMDKLPKIAEEFADKGEKDKAEKCTAIRDAFIESYTFKEMRELYAKHKIKVKKIMLEKFKRTCMEFNVKYQKSQNIIQDVQLIERALDRHAAKKFDMVVINEFICIFILYTQMKNMDPNNIVDHTFMYYFIQNILTLDYYDKNNEKDAEFHDQLINNINMFLEDINNRRAGK